MLNNEDLRKIGKAYAAGKAALGGRMFVPQQDVSNPLLGLTRIHSRVVADGKMTDEIQQLMADAFTDVSPDDVAILLPQAKLGSWWIGYYSYKTGSTENNLPFSAQLQ